MIGQEVFGYRVEEEIGHGSFATVYKVKKENESGTYIRALKHIVIPEPAQYQRIWNAMGRDEEKTDQYFEEIFQETMQEIRLVHAFTESGIRNVVSCYENDVICHENPKRYEIFILMEYLTTLSDYTSKNELTVADVLNLGIQILDALEVCHENHIIHRDVKGSNIFLTSDGICKLGDFGVAKISHGNDLITSLKGTTGYMAPEVMRNEEDYDQTVDLYSLGMVLYRLANHMRGPFLPPYPESFTSEDEKRALRRRMNGEPIPIPDAVPVSFGKILQKSLASKNMRFQHAEGFRKELVRIKESLSVESLNQSIKTERICDHKHISFFSDEQSTVDVSTRKKKKKIKLFVSAAFTIFIILISGLLYSQYNKKQMEIAVAEWEKESVIPFECISMEMSPKDFEKYYGSRFSAGVDEQYYLKLENENTQGYVTIIFRDESLESISYSFEIEEYKWLQICTEFYQDWKFHTNKWPYIAIKNSVQVMLDYDKANLKANIFVSRVTE